MLSYLRYMKGYLKISVTGYSPERFMNLCNIYGIILWGIDDSQRNADTIIFYISLNDFWNIKPIIHKTRTKVHILNKYGFPFWLRKIWHHKFFLLGFMLSILLLFYLSTFIWAIQIEGSSKTDQDELICFLSKQNVKLGIPIYKIDCEKLEKEIRNNYEFITWTSVRIEGTKLIVTLKENEYDVKEKIQNISPPMDMIADKAGKIVYMITRNGLPQKKIGDTVSDNEIIVSGSVPVYNDDETIKEWHNCISDADILIERNKNYSCKVNTNYKKKEYTGITKKYYWMKIGKHVFSVTPKLSEKKWETVEKCTQVQLVDHFFLPIYFGNTQYREFQYVIKKYTQKETEALLRNQYLQYEKSLKEKGVQIVQKNVKIVHKKNVNHLKAQLLVREEIGVLRKSDQINSDKKDENNIE